MPIYEYQCGECRSHFELLMRGTEQPICPECSGSSLTRQLSMTAAPVSSGSSLPMYGLPGRAANLGSGCGITGCGNGRCAGQ